MTVSAQHQENAMGSMRSSMASNQPIIIALPLDGLKPGSVMIMGTATANNMMDFAYMLDFGWRNKTFQINNSNQGMNEISGLQFTLKGTVFADGESVSITLQFNLRLKLE